MTSGAPAEASGSGGAVEAGWRAERAESCGEAEFRPGFAESGGVTIGAAAGVGADVAGVSTVFF